MPLRKALLPIGLVFLALSSLGYAGWLSPHTGTFEWLVLASLVLAGGITIWATLTRRPRVRLLVAGTLFTAMFGFIVASISGEKLFGVDPYSDTRYATFLSVLMVVNVVGIWRRWFAVRWLAMALAVGGIVSAGINVYPWLSVASDFTWTLLIHIAGALVIFASLWGADIRRVFENEASRIWTSNQPMMRALRWAVISQFVAIPMLLVYTWMQPIVPSTANWALGLAIFLSVSIASAIRYRVIGAIGLVLGGFGLLLLTAKTTCAAHQMSAVHGQIATYYAIFWIPAGLAAVLCGIRLAKPVLRILTQQSIGE